MKEILIDAFKDSIALVPFLFLIFLILEVFEKYFSDKIFKITRFCTKSGPLLGSIAAAIPQCWLSVIAATLYVKKYITKGTLIAIFISTSDEAVPVLLANPDKVSVVLPLVITKIIIGILIAAVIAAAGITWYVMNQKNQKTGNSSAEVVAWDVDIEEEEPSEEKGILIPGYTSMVMKANTKEQTVSIGNPADNDCIFVIVLKLEDGTKLFESQELKPGEGLENITLDQELEAGEYQAVIEYKCYSLEDKSPLNGGSAEFKLYVKE